jgi:DNA-binding response OmpR family regulator
MADACAARPLIAVIEDDPAVRHSLEFALEAQGYEVCAFERADDALRSVRLKQIRCLVIDYGLPDGNGASLLSQLRRRRITCPAIFIASSPTARCRADIAAAGAPLIEKPLLGDALGDQIRALI